MNVDDAVRQFRRSVPGPSEDLIDRIVVAVSSPGRAPSPRRRRPTGKGVLVAGSVGAAAVVFVAAGMLIRGGGSEAVPAAPAIAAARVDWGQIATVRLTPDEGVSIEEMRERFTAALAFRTRDYDGAGVEVLSSDGDRMTVRLPGAQAEAEVEAFLRYRRLVVIEEDDVLASGDSLKDIESEASRLIGPDTPVAYYVQWYLEGYGWSQATRYSSRSAAEEAMKKDGGRAEMIAVPSDLVVVGGSSTPTPQPVGLMRPGADIPSSSVRIVSIEGTRATLAIDREHRPAAGTRVRVLSQPSDTGPNELGAIQIGLADVTENGRLTVDPGYSGWTLEVPRQGIGGRVELVDAATYGQQPDAPGEPLAKALQPDLRPPSGGSEASSWRQLLTGRFDDRDYVLAAGMRGDTVVAMMTMEPGRSVNARVGGSSGGPAGVTCPAGIGTPRVVRCGGMGGGGPIDGKPDGPSVVWMMDYGRVQPGVARIVLTFGGVEREAVIKDGWWLVHTTIDWPASSSTKREDMKEAMRSAGGQPTFSAWDADGNRVPMSPPESITN